MLVTSVSFHNFDLIAVGTVIAAIGILGFVVFYSNQRSITNRTFLAFSLLTIIYSSVNYLSYKFGITETALWFLRFTVFFAIWHAFCFFQLFYVFPKEHVEFSKFYRFFIQPFVILSSIITLSPFTFMGVESVALSEAPNPILGRGMLLFAITVSGLIFGGLYALYQKIIHAADDIKKQLEFIFVGAILMFILIFAFNIIAPAVFHDVRFIPFTPIFIFPFIILTTYAIRKYRLLNIKVITTEVVSFLIAISMLLEVVLSRSATEIIFRSGIFGLVLIFTILLIRSVRREVEQRERMEALSLELAQANARLQELDKLKSEFVSMAGHQLRAPLTVIKGYVSLIMEGTIDGVSEKAKEALGKVQYSTDQLVKLVSSLLDLSRIESGKIKYDLAAHDFAQMVTEVIDKFKPNAEKKGIALVFENTLGPASFVFDADKIREAVVNYVDNAIKYSDRGEARVTLSPMAGPDGRWARLEVADSGMGIKKEDIPWLFDKFSRTDEAKIRDPNGMGIGTYFAKRVVQDHGGNVGAFSEGPGKGSTFWMELPMKNQQLT